MTQVLLDALVDSARMVPFLLVIYLLVEWLESRVDDSVQETILHAGKAGPAAGAVLGCIPQCGISVMAASLYARRLVTPGTLVAAFLSTSDEAVPVILAQPDKIRLVVPFLTAKLVLGLVAGYGLDAVLRASPRPAGREDAVGQLSDRAVGCCDHHLGGDVTLRERLVHPLVHTAKVFVFVFLVTVAINALIWRVGQANLGSLLLHHSPLQPVVTAVIGLIPNCAASVAITQVFLDGGISFGSALAGLSSAAGLGLLVLVKENPDRRDTIRIVGLVLAISIVAGVVVQAVYG